MEATGSTALSPSKTKTGQIRSAEQSLVSRIKRRENSLARMRRIRVAGKVIAKFLFDVP